jgi:hypothetical protein
MWQKLVTIALVNALARVLFDIVDLLKDKPPPAPPPTPPFDFDKAHRDNPN